ncbi:MAG: aldo/keto reductase [Limosilactobacillus sp.]
MKTVKIGDNSLPAIGIGTWHIGDEPRKRPNEVKAIRTAIDQGATVIDTAEMYGMGRAEAVVREAIDGYPREQLYIIDKVLPENASHRQLEASLDQSLQRVGTDYFDLYLLHWRGSVPLTETVEELEAMVKKGKIRHWGVSNFDVADLHELWQLPGGQNYLANEDLYNLDERGIEFDLIPLMTSRHLPLIAYSPLAQADTISGRLTTDPLLLELAANHHASVYQIMLAWTLRNGNVLSIPKAATPRHALDNVQALQITFTPDELAALNKRFPAPTSKQPLATI